MIRLIRLLLIEDNPGDVRLIREMLLSHEEAQFTFHIQTADTLKSGLEIQQATPCDILLLDLSLPDSFGVKTVAHVRQKAPDVPIVVLTGFDDQTHGIEAVQAGAQDFLVKDQTSATLLVRAIRYAIERHRAEEALRRSREEYRSLIDDVFNNSSVGVLILDKDFRVAWVNEAIETYLSTPSTQLLGKDKRELIEQRLKHIFADPDDFTERVLTAYQSNHFLQRFECHVLPSYDRQERWLEHWSQPIRSGMFAGGRIEQYTDITQRKYIEAAEREQRLLAEALREITTLLTSSLELEEVLDRILENIGQVVPHDAASIFLIETGDVYLARWADYTGHTSMENIELRRFTITATPTLAGMLETRQPVILSNIQNETGWQSLIKHEQLLGYIGIPIILQEEIIGFINLFSTAADFFVVNHVDRLQAFSAQAAIAIQNARLYEQSQALATLEERQRLARELHDSVTQTLFTTSVIAESALRQWEPNPQKAHTLLQQLHQLTNNALAEMRILLLELRPASLTKIHFRELILQLVQSLQSRRQITFNTELDDLPSLQPELQIALFRIVQEALTNIVKHAQATQARIAVQQHDSILKLVIEDNGKGFDVAKVAPSSLGLGIMHERASAVSAVLEIQSVPGKGTQLIVTWDPANGKDRGYEQHTS